MSGRFDSMWIPKKGELMFRNRLFSNFKYAYRTTKIEKIIYKKIALVVGAVLLIMIMINASALGLALFFGLGWYAKQKYDLKKKVVRKPKKKVS
jgi:UPF0716 family protein affecting phage T7 exclusion